jgi:hypothetical protein
LLQGTSQVERHPARDPAEVVLSKKHKLEAAEKVKEAATSEPNPIPKAKAVAADPTTRTDEAAEHVKEKHKLAHKPRIRPLTEAKAIDSGAAFLSETFLFLVAGSLIIFESWRSRRKENTRRESVAERLIELEESERISRQALVALEKEVLRLRTEKDPASQTQTRILPREVWDSEDEGIMPPARGWWRWLATGFGTSGNNNNNKAAAAGDDLPQPQQQQPPRQPPPETPTAGKDKPLATRIADSVSSIRRDATPPPTSPTGETEAIIDSTS